MVHLEISTWTWGKVCHFQNLSPVLEIHVHESSWTAFDHLTTFFRKNKVKKIEFRTHDLQTVGYAYISFCVTQLHINVLKDLFYCKRKYVTIYITPLTSFVSSYINFFPKFTLFHFQKKKIKKLSNNRVKITLIFEIFGPILSFPLSVCGSYPVELTSLHPISYLMTLFYPISY